LKNKKRTFNSNMNKDTEVKSMQSAKPSGDKLAAFIRDRRYAKYVRFVFAAVGSVPWVGALMGASAALHAEAEQGKINEIIRLWCEEHNARIEAMSQTIAGMVERMEQIGPNAHERVQEEGYLELVRYGFRIWDEASTGEKRERVRRVLTNAAGTKLCSDDVVRVFLDWIRKYDEIHFRVVKCIHKRPGSTRADAWKEFYGEEVREDSAEADLFSLVFRDLSLGGVIRQHRDTTPDGQFLARPRSATRGQRRSPLLESRFEEKKPYELTELGTQFIHYAMNEIVPRVGASPPDFQPTEAAN
jgi:hypothetical protein